MEKECTSARSDWLAAVGVKSYGERTFSFAASRFLRWSSFSRSIFCCSWSTSITFFVLFSLRAKPSVSVPAAGQHTWAVQHDAELGGAGESEADRLTIAFTRSGTCTRLTSFSFLNVTAINERDNGNLSAVVGHATEPGGCELTCSGGEVAAGVHIARGCVDDGHVVLPEHGQRIIRNVVMRVGRRREHSLVSLYAVRLGELSDVHDERFGQLVPAAHPRLSAQVQVRRRRVLPDVEPDIFRPGVLD